jgi:hypothetical protein
LQKCVFDRINEIYRIEFYPEGQEALEDNQEVLRIEWSFCLLLFCIFSFHTSTHKLRLKAPPEGKTCPSIYRGESGTYELFFFVF